MHTFHTNLFGMKVSAGLEHSRLLYSMYGLRILMNLNDDFLLDMYIKWLNLFFL